MLLLSAAALASVVVDDPTACVDGERLDNELSLLMGRRGEDLAIAVYVTGDGDIRRTRTEVAEGRAIVWSGRLEVDVDDCPAVAEALALTVKSGLGALPGWSWDGPSRATERHWTVELRGLATLPATADFSIAVGPDVRLIGPLGVWLQGRATTSLPVRVGVGRATQTGVGVGAGLQLAGRRLRGWSGVGTGVVWAVGQGYSDNLVSRLSRLELESGLGTRIGGSGWVALHVTAPIVRRVLRAPGGSQTESPVYAGLSLGLRREGGKRSRPGDARRLDRASMDR